MKIYIMIDDSYPASNSAQEYTQTVTVTKNSGGLPAKYNAQEVIVVRSKEALLEELSKPQAQVKLPTITATASAVVTKAEDQRSSATPDKENSKKDKGKEEESKE